MAEHDHTTPRPTGDHYIPARHPVPVRFHFRNRRGSIAGTLKGAMHRNGAVHHYRVAGDDGVLYMCPPAWFLPGHVAWFERQAFPAPMTQNERIDALFDLILAQQQAKRDGVPA